MRSVWEVCTADTGTPATPPPPPPAPEEGERNDVAELSEKGFTYDNNVQGIKNEYHIFLKSILMLV